MEIPDETPATGEGALERRRWNGSVRRRCDGICSSGVREKVAKGIFDDCVLAGTSQLYLVASSEHPKEAWDALRKHFERDTLANKLSLNKQYFRTEMKEGTYFS